MRKKQNKEEQVGYAHLQLLHRLFQVLFFLQFALNYWFNLYHNIINSRSCQYAKVSYCFLFAQFKTTYTTF